MSVQASVHNQGSTLCQHPPHVRILLAAEAVEAMMPAMVGEQCKYKSRLNAQLSETEANVLPHQNLTLKEASSKSNGYDQGLYDASTVSTSGHDLFL